MRYKEEKQKLPGPFQDASKVLIFEGHPKMDRGIFSFTLLTCFINLLLQIATHNLFFTIHDSYYDTVMVSFQMSF